MTRRLIRAALALAQWLGRTLHYRPLWALVTLAWSIWLQGGGIGTRSLVEPGLQITLAQAVCEVGSIVLLCTAIVLVHLPDREADR